MNFGYIKSKLSGKESIFNSQIKVPNKFEYNIPEVLDQGDKPICTACSVHIFLKWNYNKDFNLYKIFENSSPTQEGTQIKNVLEYLKREKLIDNYGLVKSDIVLKTAILINGPCVIGLPAYNTTEYFWKGTGKTQGHAVSIIGWDTSGFIIRNSWGYNWGNLGNTILPYEDFNKALEIWTLIK